MCLCACVVHCFCMVYSFVFERERAREKGRDVGGRVMGNTAECAEEIIWVATHLYTLTQTHTSTSENTAACAETIVRHAGRWAGT